MGRLRPWLTALTGYVVAALAFVWPLPLHLSSSLTGPIGGDTGVYVWNLWHFRHRILTHHAQPFFTSDIFSLTPPVDLSLHNYTAFADLLGLPLIPLVGITAAFNLVYIGLMVLTAFAMFLLANRIIKSAPEAWLTGALFAFSPVLITRGTGHFSLVAAVPLPVFVYCLIRAGETCSNRYAWGAGAVLAWAAVSDAYYAVFCVLLAACYVGTRWIRVRLDKAGTREWRGRVLDVGLLALASLVGFIALTGGTEFQMAGYAMKMYSLYTPVLALCVLAAVRLCVAFRPRMILRQRPDLVGTGRFVAGATLACAVPLSPVLYAFAYRLADGGTLQNPIYWRSSPSGLDLAALFVPNPGHPLVGSFWSQWLSQRPGGLIENVASISWVAMAVLAVAVWLGRFRPSRVWIVMTLSFALLALGPFVHIAGVNTYVPGPWALLRYVPVVGAARSPARFAIVMMLGFSILFGLALRHVTNRWPARRPLMLAAVGLALLFELAPAPRALYPAQIPDIYRIIADDPREIRILELPFGIRDGESSLGNFSASYQFYQTLHEKRLMGGYLSRVSTNEVKRARRHVTLRALLRLSEGGTIPPDLFEVFKARGPSFARRARLGYVVIHSSRTPPELRRFAIEVFRLEKIAEGDDIELYRPVVPNQIGVSER